MEGIRELDREPAARLVRAMKALSDTELLAGVEPLVAIQEMSLEGRLYGRRHPSLLTLMRKEDGNPRIIELYEAFGQWVFAELDHRDEVLDGLEGKG